MPRKFFVLFTVLILAFTVTTVMAQGNSNECRGKNPNCSVDGDSNTDANANGNANSNRNANANSNANTNTNTDTNDSNSSNGNNGNGVGGGIPEGSGCPGLENAFSNTEAGNSNYDVLLEQLTRHGCFIDLDNDGVDDRDDLCIGGDDNIDVDADGIPDACDPLIDSDGDGDGVGDDIDCEPNNPAIHQGAEDIPNNGIDENCDGEDAGLGRGDISFTLSWAGYDDYDLWVAEPSGETIYYGNRVSATGGELDADALAACSGIPGDAVENVYWSTGTAPEGTYTVWVDLYSMCDNTLSEWTLEVRIDGVVRETYTGTGDGTPISTDLP